MRYKFFGAQLSVILAWGVGHIISSLVQIYRLIVSSSVRSGGSGSSSVLCIEAGLRGWQSIEFQELAQSGREFIGDEGVYLVSIDPAKGYVRQVFETLRSTRPTHYLYDPRTGSQHPIIGFLQVAAILAAFELFDVVPIGYGTDISLRPHRAQIALITARRGVCVCFMSANRVRAMFPHQRVVGPALMPLSRRTFQRIQEIAKEFRNRSPGNNVSFVGSIYEPRMTLLTTIQKGLAERGIGLEIMGRVPGGERIQDVEYWERLIRSKVTLTTTGQVRGRNMDYSFVNQVVYRVTEALASGAALVVEKADGMNKFFDNGTHLLEFSYPEQAVDQIESLLSDPKKLESIRVQGRERVGMLIEKQTFWTEINLALKRHLKVSS